jgi:ribosomal protein L37AE/L43A
MARRTSARAYQTGYSGLPGVGRQRVDCRHCKAQNAIPVKETHDYVWKCWKCGKNL